MIIYDSSRLSFVWKCEGSKVPAAALYATPSALLAAVFHYVIDAYRENFRFLEDMNQSVVWAAVVIVLGILLGVRTNKAYDRFWEGITLVQQMRAEWFEATSNLLAFSMIAEKRDVNMHEKVSDFKHVLVRLMSLMHGAALRQIGGDVEDFHVLDLKALDVQSLKYLADCEMAGMNRVETILHWIQVLVTESVENGVIVTPAPIVTRAYQTLSRGMVNLHNARKLADVPFPFPMSQVIIALLMVQSVLTPFFAASVVSQPIYAAIVTFLPLFGMWSVTFIASELEQPFGSDANDLPLSALQYDFNMTLLMLSDREAGRVPRCLKKQDLRQLKSSLVMDEHDEFSRTDSLWLCVQTANEASVDSTPNTNLESVPYRSLDRGSSASSNMATQSRRKSTAFSSHQDMLEQRRNKFRSWKSKSLELTDEMIDDKHTKLEERRTKSVLECSSELRRICEDQEEHSKESAIPALAVKSASLLSSDSNYSSNPSSVNASTNYIDQAPGLTEEHLNTILDASRQTSPEPELGNLLQLQAQISKTSQPPLTPVSQRTRKPIKVKTPQLNSPMSTPRESEFVDALNNVPVRLRMDR